MSLQRILITGAAGLVGQNLIANLIGNPGIDLIAVDKNNKNLDTLKKLHPKLTTVQADLSQDSSWERKTGKIDTVVLLHAQIGGLDKQEFENNNVLATQKVLDFSIKSEVQYLVHVSSSVVNSQAVDFYTETKKAQETLVANSGIPQVILRPTLMFGWFDRKHLGWLQRFMKKAPIFPIPGSGRYLRQPLFVGDFCAIIQSCIHHQRQGTFNISGLEPIDYVNMIHDIRDVSQLRTPIVKIPFRLFWSLLKLYAIFDRDPPFTTSQLEALRIPEVFETIDWPEMFNVRATPFSEALEITFNDHRYSQVALDY